MDNDDITRRDFVKTTAVAGLAVAAGATVGAQQVVETNVEIRTPDGTCDAAFIHPAAGSHPAVVIWPANGVLLAASKPVRVLWHTVQSEIGVACHVAQPQAGNHVYCR